MTDIVKQDRTPVTDKADGADVSILYAAFVAGLINLLLIGVVSSFITSDDYYAYQNRSHFGDGRFVSGIVYAIFQGAFLNDVGFRHIVNFFSGSLGFVFFCYFSSFVRIENNYKVYFSLLCSSSIAMAESLMFFDVVALYFVVSFPIMGLYIFSLKSLVDRWSIASLIGFLSASLFAIVLLIASYQVIAYFIFVLMSVVVFCSRGAEEKGVMLAAVSSTILALLSFFIIDLFSRTGFYSDFFGYGLRGRTDFYLDGSFGIGTAFDAYKESVLSFAIFKYNSISLHLFLFLLTFSLSASYGGTKERVWRLVKLFFVVFVVYASPLLAVPGASNNARVFAALYIYGVFAYLMIIAFVLSEDEGPSRSAVFYSMVFSIVVLLSFSPYTGTGFIGKVARYEIYVGVFIFLLCALVLRIFLNASSRVILCCGIFIFCAVEWQKSVNVTERWKSDAVFDRIIVNKLTEAVLDNYYRYGFKRLEIEYGIRPETLTGASIRSYHYSAAEFWKNSVQSLGYRMNFKRNDALCAAQGQYGVFKVLESSPNTLKFCI
ncbi:MAG: hypothetical protein RLO21_03685 [Nitratireductor sp.]